VQELEEICGVPIPYDVDWQSLADDAEALNFIDTISCHRLNFATWRRARRVLASLLKRSPRYVDEHAVYGVRLP
jgi:hypothetical protein